MKAIRSHVAGVDVHKEILAITVLIGDAESEPVAHQFECSTFTDDLYIVESPDIFKINRCI